MATLRIKVILIESLYCRDRLQADLDSIKEVNSNLYVYYISSFYKPVFCIVLFKLCLFKTMGIIYYISKKLAKLRTCQRFLFRKNL